MNETIPLDNDGLPEKCIMYDTNVTVNDTTTSCQHGWTYTGHYNEETVVMEVRHSICSTYVREMQCVVNHMISNLLLDI